MKDKAKTQEELLKELNSLRSRVAELEIAMADRGAKDVELAKTRALLENISDLAYVCDDRGNILYVNKVFERLSGCKPEEFTGRSFASLFGEDDLKIANDAYARTLRGESPSFELRFIKTGTLCEYRNNPFKDHYGNIIGVLGTARDITERRKALEALERKDFFLTEAQRVACLGTYTLDIASGRWTSSETLDEVFGIDRPYEKNVEGWRNIVHPEQRDEMLAYLKKDVLTEYKNFDREYRIVRFNDRAVRWVHGLGKLIFNTNGQAVQMIGTIQDITEKKKTEEMLRVANQDLEGIVRERTENLSKSEERYRSLVDTAPHGIQENDTTGVITFVNPGLARMLGCEEGELVGKAIWDFYDTEEERQALRQYIKRLVDEEPPPTPYFSRARRKDGTQLDAKVDWNYKRSDTGELLGFIAVITDVTEQKRAEEEKERLQAQLLQSQKMEAIGTMAGGIAHDFNNIMTVVKSLTDLMIDKVGALDPFYRYLQPINESTKRALNLVQQLLLFSSNKVKETSVFSLNDAVTEIKGLLEHLLSEDISIELDLRHELWNISADRSRIEQVITNLVINSGEAMPLGGTVVIRSENIVITEDRRCGVAEAVPGNYICMSVEDTGEGIAKEAMEHIFEPFFTTKKAKNSGMGLSVVYGVVKDHNGWVSVASTPGAGAVFKVYLPATDACDHEVPEPPARARKSGDGKRILIVEDDKWVRKSTAMVLSEHGYSVFEAANAESAISAFYREKGRFDLILSDVVMPGRNGLQMVGPLADINPRVPVLLCSGHLDDKAQVSEIIKMGLTFIQKPYDIPELISAIEETISENRKPPKTTGD